MYDRSTSIRLTNIIFIAQSFFSASQIAIFTLLSIVAVELSGTETAAGFPSTTMTTAQAIMALPMGLLMGRFGRRIGLSVTYAIGVVGAIVAVFSIMYSNFPLLLVSSALLGMGRSGADQSRFAAGDLFPEHERAQMIGRIVFAGTIGAILGPILVAPGQLAAELIGLNPNTGPWVLGVAFYSLATLSIFFLLRPEPMIIAQQFNDTQKKKEKTENISTEKGRSFRELIQVPRVQLAIMSTLISQVVMVTLMVITPLYMHQHDLGTDAVSIVISAHTLGMFGLSWFTGRLIDRYGRVRMMIAGAFTLILSAIVSPLSSIVPILVIGLFLLGLGWNFGYIAGSSLLADALHGEERSRMQGANDMLVAAAAAIGSFSSGPVFGLAGYQGVAGVAIIMGILFLWIIRLLGSYEPNLKTATT